MRLLTTDEDFNEASEILAEAFFDSNDKILTKKENWTEEQYAQEQSRFLKFLFLRRLQITHHLQGFVWGLFNDDNHLASLLVLSTIFSQNPPFYVKVIKLSKVEILTCFYFA